MEARETSIRQTRQAQMLRSEENGVLFFKCKRCGGLHFRHAGYVHSLVPFMLSGGDKRIDADPKQVMICVKCRAAFVWLNSQAYDMTDQIELEAWHWLEEDALRATGPGGEC